MSVRDDRSGGDSPALGAERHERLEYTDIGHGLSESVLWIATGQRVQTATHDAGTHESIWGAEASMQNWRGRFEPRTSRISIAYPADFDGQLPVPGWLVDALRARFGQSLRIYVLKPWARHLLALDPGDQNSRVRPVS